MAISTLQLTSTGDLDLDTLSRPNYLYGQDAINQIVKMALSIWLGNWYRDPTVGVDWIGLSKKNYNKNEVISIISRAILKVPYIVQIVDVSLKVDNDRKAKIAYTIIGDRGVIIGNIDL